MGRAKANESSELLPGMLDTLILSALVRGPMHGYGIARWLEQSLGQIVQVGGSSLDPPLQRLLHNAWVKAQWRASEHNRRARYNTLTTPGRRRLTAEQREFDRLMGASRRVLEAAS